MRDSKQYRINGFEQIKAFYSWVFNNADKRVTPQHISLYLFLINQGNRNNWVEWFKVPFDLGMTGACIGNKKTYYSCLKDLSDWDLIKYEKGINEWKAPLIKLEVLNSTATDTATVPLPEPLPIPLVVPLPTPLPTHIYKLLTNNLKLITDNIEDVLKFLNDKKPITFKIPELIEVISYCKERNNNVDPAEFCDFYQSKGWMIGKNKMKDWKAAVRTWEKNSKNNGKPIMAKMEYGTPGFKLENVR